MLKKSIIIILLIFAMVSVCHAEETSDQDAINDAITEAYNMGGGIVEIDGYFEINVQIILKQY